MFDSDADETLFRFLTRYGALDPSVREAVESAARSAQMTAAEALCDGGWLDENALAEVLQQHLRLARVGVEEIPAATDGLDPDLLRAHLVVPAAVNDGRLLLAMVNPFDHAVIERLRFASGRRVMPAVALLSEVRAVHQQWFSRAHSIVEPEASAPEPSLEALRAEASDSPIIRLAARFIEQGVSVRASDIHFEPTADGLTVRFRIDGVLEETARVSAAVRNPLIARLKVMARLDIAERRVPQDGGLTARVAGRRIDCRVSTLPTQYGEKVVIRLLDAQRALARLDELGFEPHELSRLETCLRQPEGMILTTGPTGSGKSTTLYAMLRAIHSPEVNIVTVENPIEYRLLGINQTEVNERQGMTMAAALRSILRQDPDVILVGEIRDRETAEIALQAAQTGHLVLSTLHTNDAVGAISRLVNLGVEREILASTLLAVIAQRLVRRVCDQCGAPTPIADGCPPAIRRALGDAMPRRGLGCQSCRNTGYRGRIGIYQVVCNSTEIKRHIHAEASELELLGLARQQGSRTLFEAAIDKVRLGATTVDEIVAAVKDAQQVEVCPACGALRAAGDAGCGGCGSGTDTATRAWRPTAPPSTEPAVTALPDAEAMAKPTILTMLAPKVLAVGSVLGGGVRGLCIAGGLGDTAAAELEMAVVEACGIATANGTQGDLRIEVEIWAEGCGVCVADEGPAWPWPRPSARAPDLDSFAGEVVSPEARAYLIRSSVDETSYERTGSTNRLWLIKRQAAAGRDAARADDADALAEAPVLA
ncbi:Flp pilus assembly complex ATPase component TadA [bacterium]|nr:Flp pilus assembly complex ATPase component TadA [bacterium]